MSKTYQIVFDDLDLGQILDGLEIRAESWERAAEYLRTGEMPVGDFFVAEECSRHDEADAIAERYRLIVAKIRSQIEKQE